MSLKLYTWFVVHESWEYGGQVIAVAPSLEEAQRLAKAVLTEERYPDLLDEIDDDPLIEDVPRAELWFVN